MDNQLFRPVLAAILFHKVIEVQHTVPLCARLDARTTSHKVDSHIEVIDIAFVLRQI